MLQPQLSPPLTPADDPTRGTHDDPSAPDPDRQPNKSHRKPRRLHQEPNRAPSNASTIVFTTQETIGAPQGGPQRGVALDRQPTRPLTTNNAPSRGGSSADLHHTSTRRPTSPTPVRQQQPRRSRSTTSTSTSPPRSNQDTNQA